jgi:chaperonin GroES
MKKTKKVIKRVVKKVVVKAPAKKGITPLNDRVLVKPFEAEMAMTASGIIIPETVSKEKPEQGEVIAVGEGKWQDGKKIPVSVKVGDKIVFSKYGYDEVKIKGEEYYILREESILAIIN